MNDLERLFVSELRALYDTEEQFAQALTGMAQHAVSLDLKSAFQQRTDQTNSHVARLRDVFDALGQSPTERHFRWSR